MHQNNASAHISQHSVAGHPHNFGGTKISRGLLQPRSADLCPRKSCAEQSAFSEVPE